MTVSLQSWAQLEKAYFHERYPGYHLVAITRESIKPDTRLCFHLEPDSAWCRCPKCGTCCARFHDERVVFYMDWDIVEAAPILLCLPSRRLRCRCGYRQTEDSPDWILSGHRITKRLAFFIQSLLSKRITISDVSKITGVSWNLIKALDKESLQQQFGGAVDFSCVKRIALDEISIHKGHKYATVALDLQDKKVLAVLKGKRRRDIQPFFNEIKAAAAADQIESASVDMNAVYPRLVQENLPNCKLAYDLFHVMQMFNKNVLKEAKKFTLANVRAAVKELPKRSPEIKEARAERDLQVKILRHAEWLVVTKPEKLSPSRHERLQELREHNALFRDLFPLSALLRSVWKAANEDEAATRLQQCIEVCQAVAEEHNFPAIRKFGNMLIRRSEGIITACVVRLGTNVLEGANNTAKVIKRLAYGFKDFSYFALKLKSAFPGKNLWPIRGRHPQPCCAGKGVWKP